MRCAALRPRTPRQRSADAGQATVLMVLVLAAAVGAATLIVQVGAVASDRAKARTAADAAALAGAAEGSRDAAAMAAGRNGATLEELRIVDGQTEATVRVGRARATSRAVVGPVRMRAPRGAAAPLLAGRASRIGR
jgi:hypothetical protein